MIWLAGAIIILVAILAFIELSALCQETDNIKFTHMG